MIVRAALLGVLLLGGCSTIGGDIQRVIDAYQAGNFQRAMNGCTQLRDDVPRMNQKGRVRYLVFCGLSAYEMGDRQAALAWLRKGKEEYMRGDPRWLHAHAAENMSRALATPESPPAQ